eukprot:TRINITY_DN5502_c0_g1_i1.p1 TRINITY_DN5502_c0_g1~~TRINITY_DN5502_c0_g1_i1.p1  ORF type:complete len:106 (-),score=13.44 TRINITY_DN5502_c0_g1_i1:249-566(-)
MNNGANPDGISMDHQTPAAPIQQLAVVAAQPQNIVPSVSGDHSQRGAGQGHLLEAAADELMRLVKNATSIRDTEKKVENSGLLKVIELLTFYGASTKTLKKVTKL